MNGSWALLLLGAGVLVWPVRSRSRQRLTVLGTRARVLVAAPPSRRVLPRLSPLVVGLALVPVALLALGPALGVAAVAAVGTVALPVRASLRDAGRARFRRDLAVALAVLQGELDAGTPLVDALAAARERAGSAWSVLGARAAGVPVPGQPVPVPVAGPSAPGPEARVFAAGAAVVAATGAAWSDVVAGIARDAAARADREREVQAALAGARASMLLLAGLPVLGVGLAAAMGADPLAFLLHAPAGRALLALGAVLQLTGVAVTLRLAGGAAS